jgi:hypothetical protein
MWSCVLSVRESKTILPVYPRLRRLIVVHTSERVAKIDPKYFSGAFRLCSDMLMRMGRCLHSGGDGTVMPSRVLGTRLSAACPLVVRCQAQLIHS